MEYASGMLVRKSPAVSTGFLFNRHSECQLSGVVVGEEAGSIPVAAPR
jgi:hypothetical protein